MNKNDEDKSTSEQKSSGGGGAPEIIRQEGSGTFQEALSKKKSRLITKAVSTFNDELKKKS